MSAIEWNGKGLKVASKVLSSVEVKDWLTTKASDLLKETVDGLPNSWFNGTGRAQGLIFDKTSAIINESPTFRIALEDSLAVLPAIVRATGSVISTRKVEGIVVRDDVYTVVAIPRATVRRLYLGKMLDELHDSAELSPFRCLPEYFLRKKSYDSENAFFKLVRSAGDKNLPVSSSLIISGDNSYKWVEGAILGHYYWATAQHQDNLDKPKARKDFLAQVKPLLDKLKITVGKLSVKDVERVNSSLDTIEGSAIGYRAYTGKAASVTTSA